MDRLRGIASFVVIAALFFAALRLVHLAVPVFYPKVLAGPFSLDDFAAVEEITGFSPLLPFYRPQELGERPVAITATRRPHPGVVVFWQGEHFLYLSSRRGGRLPAVPATARPLPRHPDARWWRDGATHYVVLERRGLEVELRTDLGLEDVERIVETLRPYEELL